MGALENVVGRYCDGNMRSDPQAHFEAAHDLI
jgi:hypothetical protein